MVQREPKFLIHTQAQDTPKSCTRLPRVVDWKDGCVPPMIDAPCTLLVQRAFHTLRRRVAHQAASQATLCFGIDGCGRKI